MRQTELDRRYPNAHYFPFGDSPDMADSLLVPILSGEKTATCGSYQAYRQEPSLIGDYCVVLDGSNQPACVIRILAHKLVRFCDVTEAMAAQEGEGDKSLAHWRAEHGAFFSREGNYEPEMLLVFEQFSLIEVLI